MYVDMLKKEAIEMMRQEATRLREEYLEYAEDMETYANPEFWAAVEEVEGGKTRKLSLKELGNELGI